MGQYRFSIYAHWQIGLLIKVDKYSIDIHLPFIAMHIGLSKHANGNNLNIRLWNGQK